MRSGHPPLIRTSDGTLHRRGRRGPDFQRQGIARRMLDEMFGIGGRSAAARHGSAPSRTILRRTDSMKGSAPCHALRRRRIRPLERIHRTDHPGEEAALFFRRRDVGGRSLRSSIVTASDAGAASATVGVWSGTLRGAGPAAAVAVGWVAGLDSSPSMSVRKPAWPRPKPAAAAASRALLGVRRASADSLVTLASSRPRSLNSQIARLPLGNADADRIGHAHRRAFGRCAEGHRRPPAPS